MRKTIGIDVSKRTLDVAVVTPEGLDHVIRLTNTQKGWHRVYQLASPDSCCVMEGSGNYYLKLAYYLYERDIQVSVVNPLIIRRYAQMQLSRAKTDKKDAQLIATFGMREQPELWQPDEKAIASLRHLYTVLEQYERTHTAISNQLESARQLPIPDDTALRSLEGTLEKIEQEINKLEDRMEEIIQQHYKATYTSLQSIPGIGTKTATMLIAITNNFEKFEHYKQLVAYVGLSPRTFRSGTSVRGKGHICKMGMGKIRKLLYLCSWTAKFANIHCRKMYERLKTKGKPERVIKVALANKLLRQAFAIGKNKTVFQENYTPKFEF